MSDYPKWWASTITIFNKYEDSQTGIIKWYRTVVDNCFWKNQFQRFKMGDVEVQSDTIICRIPEKLNFKEKYLWDNVPNDQKASYFTLAQGDIVIKGDIEEDIDEYTSGHRSSDVIEKYKTLGCMVIDRISNNTGVGLGIPHYHIEGI